MAAEIIVIYAMKSLFAFLDKFFGLGAVLVLLDVTVFDGGIEEMIALPYPLKVAIGILMAVYLFARIVYFVVSKSIEVKERLMELRRKEREMLKN